MTDIWEYGSNIFDGGFLDFIISAAVIIVIAIIIAKAIKRGMKTVRERTDANSMQVDFAIRLICFIIYAIAAFIVLSGIKPLAGLGTAVLGATSIISVVVGLAAQESFGNFIAGFFLAMYHPFDVGDVVYLSEQNIIGVVKEITFRHTELITSDKTTLIIPNSVMNSAIVENKSTEPYFRKVMTVDVAYDTDIELAKRLILEAALSTDGVIDTRTDEQKAEGAPIFKVIIDTLGESGITLKFGVDMRNFLDHFAIAGELRGKILKAFDENGIEIPYTKIELVNK